MEKMFEELRSMLKAHFPLMYLVTSEYNRVTQKVRTIAYDGQYSFHTWDCVSGLRTHTRNGEGVIIKEHNHHEETMDCETLLEYLCNTITDDLGDKHRRRYSY